MTYSKERVYACREICRDPRTEPLVCGEVRGGKVVCLLRRRNFETTC